jgi:hypothetical protein
MTALTPTYTVQQGEKILDGGCLFPGALREGWSLAIVGIPNPPIRITIENYRAALQPEEGEG